MEIGSGKKPAFLSNHEVLSLLKHLRTKQKRINTRSQLATIMYETIQYLEGTPCVGQEPEMIARFLRGLESFKLTKAEKLMLINNPPTTPLEIQLMVEESEDRLTDEQVEKLLQLSSDSGLTKLKDEEDTAVS